MPTGAYLTISPFERRLIPLQFRQDASGFHYSSWLRGATTAATGRSVEFSVRANDASWYRLIHNTHEVETHVRNRQKKNTRSGDQHHQALGTQCAAHGQYDSRVRFADTSETSALTASGGGGGDVA